MNKFNRHTEGKAGRDMTNKLNGIDCQYLFAWKIEDGHLPKFLTPMMLTLWHCKTELSRKLHIWRAWSIRCLINCDEKQRYESQWLNSLSTQKVLDIKLGPWDPNRWNCVIWFSHWLILWTVQGAQMKSGEKYREKEMLLNTFQGKKCEGTY